MKMPKATDADKDRFRSLIPEAPEVEVKPMFGQLGAFVNGNMFAGLFGSEVGVKVDPADQADLRAAGAGPFGPEERPMGGYLTLPASFSPAETTAWVEKAVAYVGAMPPKTTRR